MGTGANLKNRDFYRGKRVFVTGHTGYKGAWLTAILHELGAEATGYSRAVPNGGMFEQIGGESLIQCVWGDTKDCEQLKAAMREAQPEIVIHLSALVTVGACYADPVNAFETNTMSCVNLLEAVRQCPSVKSVVIITTDKVYENKGDGAVYKETDPLTGTDPLSASKTCMEYAAQAYRNTYLQKNGRMTGVATVRASNVLGGGDHDQSRLVPSILNAIAQGKPVEIRNPHQTRPWQSMLDALNGYLSLGRLMYNEPEKYSGSWNIGPTLDGIREVSWVVEKLRSYYAGAKYVVGDALPAAESQTLGLNIEKALRNTDWEPIISCDKMIFQVVDYQKRQQAGEPEREIVRRQIREFFQMDSDYDSLTDMRKES